MSKKVVLATRNLGKIEEFQRMLQAASLDIEVLGLKGQAWPRWV